MTRGRACCCHPPVAEPQPPLLLTAEETATLLSVSRRTVYELIARSDIRSVTIGRSRRIPFDAAKEYVNSLSESA